jgi:hypothetical protein
LFFSVKKPFQKTNLLFSFFLSFPESSTTQLYINVVYCVMWRRKKRMSLLMIPVCLIRPQAAAGLADGETLLGEV